MQSGQQIILFNFQLLGQSFVWTAICHHRSSESLDRVSLGRRHPTGPVAGSVNSRSREILACTFVACVCLACLLEWVHLRAAKKVGRKMRFIQF